MNNQVKICLTSGSVLGRPGLKMIWDDFSVQVLGPSLDQNRLTRTRFLGSGQIQVEITGAGYPDWTFQVPSSQNVTTGSVQNWVTTWIHHVESDLLRSSCKYALCLRTLIYIHCSIGRVVYPNCCVAYCQTDRNVQNSPFRIRIYIHLFKLSFNIWCRIFFFSSFNIRFATHVF